MPGLTSDVAQLTELATTVVTTELQERFAEFAADYLDRAERPLPDDDEAMAIAVEEVEAVRRQRTTRGNGE